ncbi:MAG: aminodeoxychorismate/anthranilate synthase component II [Sedimentisphaerales bacterium]|nr:aminodeoxychorismate/anthranilate synthase component II [Sedimentisphaerales bacterium]
MNRIVIIDNYDSFTYNLLQAIMVLDAEAAVEVALHDAVDQRWLEGYRPTHLVISPGPGNPAHAGQSNDLIRWAAGRVALLGVCLGHQCIAEVFGGRIVRAARCWHGKTSAIHHDGRGLFDGLPNPFTAMRYHSLVVDPRRIPAELTVSAWSAAGEVMALRHQCLPIESVQFHPESFATEHGPALLRNFLFPANLDRPVSGDPAGGQAWAEGSARCAAGLPYMREGS